MTDITPPSELVQQWRKSGPADAAVNNAYECHIATCAAQWGADMELEACCEWMKRHLFSGLHLIKQLRAALRAAADQVVPEQAEPPCGESEPWPQSYQLMADSKWEQRQQTRAELLAIAAELEGSNG